MEATVSEIHEYPLRPDGYSEPLFHSLESRLEILEHLARSSWLSRASDMLPNTGHVGHVAHAGEPGEPVEVSAGAGTPTLIRGGKHRSNRRITRVLECWREIGEWWSPDGGQNQVLYRVEVSGSAVLDLSRAKDSKNWILVGIVD